MARLAVFVGDLHAGSTVAVCPPLVEMGEDGVYAANEAQRWLYARWQEFIGQVQREARGQKIVLVLGGDLIDGPRHHGTFQSWGTAQAQVGAAVELLRPLANLARHVYGLRGTACHGGQSGADDAAVVKELGGVTEYRWRLEIDGALFDVAHHGRRDTRPWTLGNAAMQQIRQARARVQATGERAPHYIIRHHVHKYDQIEHGGMTAAACPSWQLQTEHGRRIDPANIDDVGGLIWDRQNGLRPVLYQPAPDPVTVVPAETPGEY